MLKNIEGLTEDVMYISQGEIPMSGGDAVYQWICKGPVLTSQYDKPVGVLGCTQ